MRAYEFLGRAGSRRPPITLRGINAMKRRLRAEREAARAKAPLLNAMYGQPEPDREDFATALLRGGRGRRPSTGRSRTRR